MFSAFDLKPGSWSAADSALGQQEFNATSTAVKSGLEKFLSVTGTVNGSQMADEWFPTLKADIFLSHSHEDQKLAIQFAGWIKQNFALTTFIDSCVWGHSDGLLRAIDNAYCYDSASKTYNYDTRNKSTSHVHMMLAAALSKMMDKTECLIFLNTPSSLTTQGAKNKTTSPWIYYELSASKTLRIQEPPRHLQKSFVDDIHKTAGVAREISKALSVSYDVDSRHLVPLNAVDLQKWKLAHSSRLGHPLDALYALKLQKKTP